MEGGGGGCVLSLRSGEPNGCFRLLIQMLHKSFMDVIWVFLYIPTPFKRLSLKCFVPFPILIPQEITHDMQLKIDFFWTVYPKDEKPN